jgi:hypothetical protein
MPRETAPVTKNNHGDDVHPAFGQIQAHRYSSTPGSVLFDSDIRHGHTVGITISRATRKRDLNRDWIYGGKELINIEMSEAQWASFVSSMGSSGVPVTLRRTENEVRVPDLEYDPRLAHSIDEVKGAAQKTFEHVKAAIAAYDALDPKAGVREKRAAFDKIRNAVGNAEPNIAYVARSLSEHAENVVQRSRADIEAMALQAAQHMGLPEGTRLLELED